jgi:hypothetical protein
MFLLALAICASPAQAAIPTPVLLGTAPDSPGVSTEPLLHGRLGGEGTSLLGTQAEGLGPVRAAVDPNATVSIYTDAACLGPVETTGIVAELEGAGIQLDVDPGSTMTFYATATEGSETSNCSQGLVYRNVSAPPPVPLLSSVTPVSPADDNFPRLHGVADPESTVAIYTDSACEGPPVSTGSGEALGGAGIAVLVPDNSTTTFYARASWAVFVSACSESSLTYQEVTVAPEQPPADPGPGGDGGGGPEPSPQSLPIPGKPAAPKLRTVPGGRAHDLTPLVAGSAAGATRVEVFTSDDCRRGQVATGTPAQLAAGFAVEVDPNSTTNFYGVAIAADGDRSPCSDSVTFSEDSMPPLTRITFGPGVKTRKRIAVFRFADITGDPPGTSFLCKFDRRPWRACQSPWRLSKVKVKAHVVRIRATDLVGNEEPVGAKRRFKVIAR